MGTVFEQTFRAGWGDMDFNGHMRNTAYLDAGATTRMLYFDAHGFSMREFEPVRFGPVITRDDIRYFKEIRLLESYTVTLELAGASEDGIRFRMRNTFLKDDGKPAAVLTSTGGWLSLEHRRLEAPPEPLRALIESLARTEDFEHLPTK
ncbi:MAG: thioesterase [Candidatus Hydrogenedens sp.]|nr:thioesterase [Candidatus Hydrogenedens sp.]